MVRWAAGAHCDRFTQLLLGTSMWEAGQPVIASSSCSTVMLKGDSEDKLRLGKQLHGLTVSGTLKGLGFRQSRLPQGFSTCGVWGLWCDRGNVPHRYGMQQWRLWHWLFRIAKGLLAGQATGCARRTVRIVMLALN